MGTDNTNDSTDETPDESGTDTTDTGKTDDKGHGDAEALKRALDRERTERREADKERKALKAELDKIKAASMSDTEKAIADATAKVRAEVMAEVGSTLVDAEFRAASAGFTLDVDALLESLDRSKFMGDDGKPDKARIGEFVSKLAPARRSAATDTGQGARKDGTGPAQITDRAALKTMTPQQIETARKEGRLKTLMGG